ncbi:rolling circle replication-associated protein [Janibacter anophelis]|uniref:rolling circle replication-associated protein n=1 Tax=Janibacter anophelis TaxID=319054 RepID=UPI003F7EF4E4
MLSVYLEAAEASGAFVCGGPREYVPRGEGKDPARSARVANGRAAGALRRYAAANRLNKLGTLTYAGQGCHDPRALRRDVGDFFLSLRQSLGGEAFPYVWVPEWHPGGHGLHVHFGVGRYIRRSLIERAWGRGFVHIKLLSDLPVGSGSVGEARKVASYLSKYVSKDLGAARVPGLHRYEVAQEFQPQRVRVEGVSAEDVLAQASALLGSDPVSCWFSWQSEGWQGPSAVAAQWAA